MKNKTQLNIKIDPKKSLEMYKKENKLTTFLVKNFQNEMKGESPVDMAIRLLKNYKLS